jgi:hypothetical protein
MPRAMRPGRPEGVVTTLAVILEPHHILPPPAIQEIENLRGCIPAITQDIRGLQPTTARLTKPIAHSTFDGPPFRHSRIPTGTFYFPSVHNNRTTCISYTGLPTLLNHTHLTASTTQVKRSQLMLSITREPPFCTSPRTQASHSRRAPGTLL